MANIARSATQYRPDIDGLRAVAVGAVLLYHAGFQSFGGGFVGVDVFFVISGYLITRILVAELAEKGRVDLGAFYLRRARRLLPALFVTLIASGIAATILLSPQRLEDFGASLLHAVLSVSNVHFYAQSGYFDDGSKLKPLLHTWSLGVEEQFYLVWPLLIAALVARGRVAPLVLAVVAVASFAAAQALVATNPSAVFFLTPFRVFEFSVGAALTWVRPPSTGLGRRTSELLAAAGLSLIAYAIFGFGPRTVFPAAAALVPCLGAALCILSCETAAIGGVLRSRPVVWVGLISYSLYLVHWPLIVFYGYQTGHAKLSPVESVLLVLASVTLAAVMHRWVETPFRRGARPGARFPLASAFTALAVCYASASMWALDGWPWRAWTTTNTLSNDAIAQGKDRRFQVRQRICTAKGWEKCDDLAPGKVNALIMGDSHAVDALNAFAAINPENNFSMSDLGGCPPHSDIESITLPTHPDRAACKALNQKRHDPAYLRQFDYIVINVLFGWYTAEHLREYLDFLKKNRIDRVVIFGEYLVLDRDLPDLINEFGYDEPRLRDSIDTRGDLDAKLREYSEKNGYLFVSKRDAFCMAGTCELFDEHGVPFTYDRHHLSYEFASRMLTSEKARIARFVGKSQVR